MKVRLQINYVGVIQDYPRARIERNNITHPIYIGDTDGDSKSAAFINAPFIFASYGFGKTDKYDAKIEKPEDILDIIEYI